VTARRPPARPPRPSAGHDPSAPGPGPLGYTRGMPLQPVTAFLRDFYAFLRTRKRFWLLPLLVLLALLGLLVFVTSGSSAAPHLYTHS